MKTETCEIGAQATIFIALNSTDERGADLEAISSELNVPSLLVATILRQLEQAEILLKAKGDYRLNPNHPSTLVLSVLVEAIDKDSPQGGCGYGLHPCSSSEPCALHDQFIAMREEIDDLMATASLSTI